MNKAKASLLIVEDDLDIADMLDSYFRAQGYDVTVVNWGVDGVTACLDAPPDLLILDIRLPDIDGFEVAHRIRANRRAKDTPVIFLTEKRERDDRLHGLSLRAEDYITKPFDIQELRLRVSNVLERSRRSSHTNPVTGLPEGRPVDEGLAAALADPESSISVLSLKNLDRFREVYGFVASDDLLRGLSLIVQETLRDHGSGSDFLGHLHPADFVLITRSTNLPILKTHIGKRVGPSLDYYYRDQDRDTDLFRGCRLAFEIVDYTPGPTPVQTVAQIKAELERLHP